MNSCGHVLRARCIEAANAVLGEGASLGQVRWRAVLGEHQTPGIFRSTLMGHTGPLANAAAE
jgi:hypothetical protein